jgi:dTDP-4-amino-4,6-dideoxygalactose transaminase
VFAIGAEERLALQKYLVAHGIQTLVHYDPLPHLTSAFRDDGWAEGALPQAERLARRALSLPMFPQLTLSDCDEVVSVIKSRA